jgi:hypothetical protein
MLPGNSIAVVPIERCRTSNGSTPHDFGINTSFYKKCAVVFDSKLFVVGSNLVPDAAIQRVASLAATMLGNRSDIVDVLVQRRHRFAVMARKPLENQTTLPEYRDLCSCGNTCPAPEKNSSGQLVCRCCAVNCSCAKNYWDSRSRGLGGDTFENPVTTSSAEENLLCYANDPFWNGGRKGVHECIFVHEFAHTMHLVGMQTIDKPWFNRTRAAYTSAMAAGKWNNSYSAVNYKEYWAEGVQAYFSCARSSMPAHTKQQLELYDPTLAGLIAELYPDVHQYECV